MKDLVSYSLYHTFFSYHKKNKETKCRLRSLTPEYIPAETGSVFESNLSELKLIDRVFTLLSFKLLLKKHDLVVFITVVITWSLLGDIKGVSSPNKTEQLSNC